MIRLLPQSTIDRIAAGQIIQRPYNAIKELLENSIDAGSTSITVSILNGGLKSIQITDNGKGIPKEDYQLLATRFATSKITNIEDLLTIDSFGFRGQALASLSIVSQLEVVSKHIDSPIAYKCSFQDQQPTSAPQPTTFNCGTKITANNLFFKFQSRRNSLSPNQEKKRIIKLIQHFALHFCAIQFKIISEKGVQYQNDVLKQPSQSKLHTFQQITNLPYDNLIYKAPQSISMLKCQAILTKLNTTYKSKTLYLNINNRIVQSNDIFKIVEKSYSQCYRSIHEDNETFCVYLNLTIQGKYIDCNVHPNKKNIGFFAGDSIFQYLYQHLFDSIKTESAIKSIRVSNLGSGNQGSQMVEKEIASKSKVLFTHSQGQDLVQPIPAYLKNRTAPEQLPLKYYIKSEPQQSNTFIFNYTEEITVQGGETQKEVISSNEMRDFFQRLSYVGTFNLNYLLIHYDNKLQMLNILPFLSAYINSKLQDRAKLCLQKANIDVVEAVCHFSSEHPELKHKINLEDCLNQFEEQKNILKTKYAIQILDKKILIFPVLSNKLASNIKTDELIYFLLRVIKDSNTLQKQNWFVEWLSSAFINKEKKLSAFNMAYDSFLREELIPYMKIRKMRAKDGVSNETIQRYMRSMLDLKDAYKIFERC